MTAQYSTWYSTKAYYCYALLSRRALCSVPLGCLFFPSRFLVSAPAFAQDIDLGTFDTDDSEEEDDEKDAEADDDILDLEDPDDDEWAVPVKRDLIKKRMKRVGWISMVTNMKRIRN